MNHPLDRARSLHPENEWYRNQVRSFFEWQMLQDGDDLTAALLIDETVAGSARITAKEGGVLSGQAEIDIFLADQKELVCTWNFHDGDEFQATDEILTLQGPAKLLLKYERVILNVLSRMSGIATVTRKMTTNLPMGVALAATRKTLWGPLDKKAVADGGGLTHRLGLFDAVLVKENHLALLASGGVEAAKKIKNALRVSPEKMGAFWEIEVENEAEFHDILAVLKDLNSEIPGILMLDNFAPANIARILSRVDKDAWNKDNIFFEASGGITSDNYLKYAITGINIISSGFLTHTPKPIDFSMRIVKG